LNKKDFFFEKKKQKTLILHRALLPGQGLMSRDASFRWHDGISLVELKNV
jgi:hypothetical protein